MKYTVLGPLLSALVLPGLGQVVCGQVMRGLTLMGLTTILFLVLLVKLALMFREAAGAWVFFGRQLISGPFLSGTESQTIPFILTWMSLSLDLFFGVLVGGLLGVWLYGVLDGFRQGRRADAAGPTGGER
ncbi:MAG: hypothetical protein KJ621_14400 [Proteobacteria bacterium]|nr:hypothetical protein [Pseudomonadota bacterium]MBU1741152.1 hypothetical protein [Pseudomonadota bacterium]